MWTRWINRARTSRYGRNFLHVVAANALAQSILLAAAPFLSRLYGPEAFGAFGIFTAIVGVGLAVVTGRLEWLIPNPRSHKRAGSLLALGLVITALSCFAASLVLAWFPRAALPASWTPLVDLLGLVPWALAGIGMQQLLQAWHVRGTDLLALSRVKTFQDVANIVAALSAVWLFGQSAREWGLVAGMMVGAWAGALGLWQTAEQVGPALKRISLRRLVLTWHRYQGQIGWSTLAAVLNASSLAVVPLLLARHYSVAEVGFYTLTQRVAFVPIGVLSSAVRQSFWAEAVQQVRRDPVSLLALFKVSIRRLSWIAAVVALCALAGPLYVGPIFGNEQWERAGWVLAASVPMLIGQIVASPLSHLEVHGKQRWQAMWDSLRIVAFVLILEATGRSALPLPVTVLAMSLVAAVMYVILMLLNVRALKSATATTSSLAA